MELAIRIDRALAARRMPRVLNCGRVISTSGSLWCSRQPDFHIGTHDHLAGLLGSRASRSGLGLPGMDTGLAELFIGGHRWPRCLCNQCRRGSAAPTVQSAAHGK